MLNKNKLKLDEITDAVTFEPNEEEFKEPLEYINKIRPIAEKYGICKIIPPKHWKPPFSIDMYNFKFRPRIQRLNELEANSRIKLNFLEQLSKFWELQGKKFRVPIVEGKQLDIYKLYKTVEQLGGYETITKNKRWAQLAKQLLYKDTYTCTTLKTHYENLLYPYLLFEAGVTLPENSKNKRNFDSEPDDETESIKSQKTSKRQKLNKIKSKKTQSQLEQDKIEQIKCLVCNRGDDEAFMLLCDGCDDSYHTFCLYPPLKEIPKGEWRCPICVAEICKKPTDAYGFEQSKQEYNLIDFGKMAAKFKTEYFKKELSEITPEEVEKEFWRILASPDESVEVEYGADLHTLETGSGFPTRSNRGKYKDNYEPYVDSPWNLNNLSLLDKSVLSQMNVEISGMKIPWAYVGMCFSCFCWHVEDHWSYSINYLHMGEIKTWYGISGLDAEKFEDCMKQNAKELFDKSPDLLHHLVTIMNPVFLKQNGVPIYRINQKAGEFVVTFPRAYHAGFNQGYNFAEAVNFCPADWMPLGRAAIENYKLVKRHTVFSHDELVCKVALNKNILDLNTNLAIQNELKIIIDLERDNRKMLLEKGVKNARKLAFEMLSDDDRTCDYCKTTCFVSALNCSCKPEKLVCLNHYEHLCDCVLQSSESSILNQSQSHKFTVLYRYEMQELFAMYSKLKQQTDNYFKWCSRVESLLGLNNSQDEDILIEKPSIKTFCQLYQEAKDNKYPMKIIQFNKIKINLLSELEKELNFAISCSKLCKKYLNLFKNKNEDEQNIDEEDEEENDDDDEIVFLKKTKTIRNRPSLESLKNLSKDLLKLKCEIDEAELFSKFFIEVLEYESKIETILKKWDLDRPEEIKSVLDYLDRIDIEFPIMFIEKLNLMHKQSVWLKKVNQSVQDPSKFTIKIIKDLIDEFSSENLLTLYSFDEKYNNENIQKSFVDLQELLSIAQTWDDKAKILCDQKSSTSKLEDLDIVLKEASFIPVKMENVDRLELIVKEAKKLNQQADLVLKDPSYPYLSDLREILKKVQDLPAQLQHISIIETRVKLANDWLNSVEPHFIRTDVNTNYELLDLLTPRLDLYSIVNKLQLNLNNLSQSLSPEQPSKSLKRQRTKSLNNLLSNRLNTSTNNISNEIEIVTNYDSTNELYKERNFLNLSEKYKLLQIKELDYLKQLRKLNQEKISFIKTYVQNLLATSSSSDTIETHLVQSVSSLQQFLNKIKCASCSHSILNRIHSNQFKQCKLCFGLYCHTCKSTTISNSDKQSKSKLCTSCERSKRPKLDLVINLLVTFESFELRSQESNALQMCINRLLTWIDKYDKLISDSEVSCLFDLFDKQTSNLNEHFNEKLNPIKRVELQDLYLDSQLIEIETDKQIRLKNLFELIEFNQTEYDDLKILTEKLSLIKNLQSQTTESNNNTTITVVTTTITQQSTTNRKSVKSNKLNKIKPEEIGAFSAKKQKLEKQKYVKKEKEEEQKQVQKQSRKRDLSQVTNKSSEDTTEEEYCAAMKCVKPSGDNIKWVQCDGSCNKWFHMVCVGITKIKRKEKYLCHVCNDNHDDSSNSSMSSINSKKAFVNLNNNSIQSEEIKPSSETTRMEIENLATELNESNKINETTEV